MSKRNLLRLLELLHLPADCRDWRTVKAAFREEAKTQHPDKGGSQAIMTELNVLMALVRGPLESGDIPCSQAGPSSGRTSGFGSFSSTQDPSTPPRGWSQERWDDFVRRAEEDDSRFSSPFSTPPRKRARPSSPDLHCDEEMPSSPGDSDSQGAPQSQGTPQKESPPHIPEPLRNCLCKGTTNTTRQHFLLHCSALRVEQLKERLFLRFPVIGFKHVGEDTSGEFLYLHTIGKHRVSALQRVCNDVVTLSYAVVYGVPMGKVRTLVVTLGMFGTRTESEGPEAPGEESGFVFKLFSDYCCDNEITDPLILMARYRELGASAPGKKSCATCEQDGCDSPHFDEHYLHYHNALLFAANSRQKMFAGYAIEVLTSERKYRLSLLDRAEQYELYVRHATEKIEALGKDKGPAGILELCRLSVLFEGLVNMERLVRDLEEIFVKARPKRRYLVFRGPLNSGKTTVAAGVKALLHGVSLNINCPADKLPFEVGMAMDRSFVIFEDVKGCPDKLYSSFGELPPGVGMFNLDDMRDHLDGAVEVNLEKKHQNKVSQLFPPGIITMNYYVVPATVKVRVRSIYSFHLRPNIVRFIRRNDINMRSVISAEVFAIACAMCENAGEAFLRLQEYLSSFDIPWGKYKRKLRNGGCIDAPDSPPPTRPSSPPPSPPDSPAARPPTPFQRAGPTPAAPHSKHDPEYCPEWTMPGTSWTVREQKEHIARFEAFLEEHGYCCVDNMNFMQEPNK